MSHPNRWKSGFPKKTAKSRPSFTPTTPPPNASKKLVGRIFQDCLAPRQYQRITDDERNNSNFVIRDFGVKSGSSNRDTIFRPRNGRHHHRNIRERFTYSIHGVRERFSHSFHSRVSIPSLQEEREQALRDYKVTIEYKHLKSHAPGGVYLIPSMNSLRDFYGVIFVRRGPFTNGIFKFRLNLPPKYNDVNMWPKITFSSRVYNPYVDAETGELDVQSAYPEWDPSRHYLVTVLTYLKKIFYAKNFADARANVEAKSLAESDPQAYKKKVEECVHESQKKVYVNDKGSTAQFTEESVAHRVLRDLLKQFIKNENQVTKQVVMAQIEKARKV